MILSTFRNEQALGLSSISMQKDSEAKIFVGGLPWALDSEDLREAFQEFGQVTEANVVYDRETGRSRGFGFVSFAEPEQAQKALEAMDQAVRNPLVSCPLLLIQIA